MRADERNGHGHFKYPNGDNYYGDWLNNLFSG